MYEDKKDEYHRHQRMYHRIDEKTTEQLKAAREVLKKKYMNLFNFSGTLKGDRAKKLERLYYIIDNRIGENLKLWR